MTISSLTVGTKVSGVYHDVAYTGTIIESRIDAASFRYLLTVALDKAIDVYGTNRARIHFSDNDFVTVKAA